MSLDRSPELSPRDHALLAIVVAFNRLPSTRSEFVSPVTMSPAGPEAIDVRRK